MYYTDAAWDEIVTTGTDTKENEAMYYADQSILIARLEESTKLLEQVYIMLSVHPSCGCDECVAEMEACRDAIYCWLDIDDLGEEDTDDDPSARSV